MLDAVRKQSSDRVVIVSNYTKTLDLLAAHCAAALYPTLRLDGSTPLALRQSLVDRFNDRASDSCASRASVCRRLFHRHVVVAVVFLLSTKAGGVGLNLIGANRLVLYVRRRRRRVD